MSSILQDKHLLELFYKIAQTPTTIPEQITFSDLSYALDSLGKQLNGAPKLSFENDTVGATDNIGPKTKDFSGLDTLLSYLSANQVKADGILLAIKDTNDESLNEKYTSMGYILFGSKEGLNRPDFYGKGAVPTTGKYKEEAYWVHKDNFVKYIRFLQNTAFNEKDKVMEVMIGKIIDTFNLYYKDSGLSRKPTSVPGETVNALPDDTILDKLPKTLDSKQPLASGSVPLLSKDIKEYTALNNWMDTNGISINGTDWKDGNKCEVIQILYKRANYLYNNAKNQEEKKNAQYYSNKIKEISSQFTGPDGKACSISGGVGGNIGSTPGALNQRILIELLSMLPFDKKDIDLKRCERFNAKLASLSERAAELINELQTKRQAIISNLNSPTHTLFPLSSGSGEAQQFIALTKYPHTSYFKPLMNALYDYIAHEKIIVTDMLNAFGGGGYGGSGAETSKFTMAQNATIQGNIEYGELNLSKLSQILQEYNNLPKSK